MSKRSRNAGLVYSSDHGRMCPKCGKPEASCTCGEAKPRGAATGDGVVRVSRETKGRKGKTVSVVTSVPLAGAELDKLARQLKQRCGAGGTVRDGTIEIQGEHRDALVTALESKGWTVKRAGG